MDEVFPYELLFPVPARVDLVDEDGALFATVPSEVPVGIGRGGGLGCDAELILTPPR